jgi:hypothetical protein
MPADLHPSQKTLPLASLTRVVGSYILLSYIGTTDLWVVPVLTVMHDSIRYCHDCAWLIRDSDPQIDDPTASMIGHAVTTGHDVERA